ncbi:MAG: mandelate racemase [Deltaproteobacteria bacterium]|nr:mandelate racemase [Deltaproteobacteria bacterium]
MINKIEIFDLRLPLTRPYRSALGELTELTTLIIRLVDDGNQEAYGETTSALGYSWEGPEDVWDLALRKGPELPGKGLRAASELFAGEQMSFPFGVTSWLTALELLEKEPLLEPTEQETLVPLTGLVNAFRIEEVPDIVEKALASGYKSLKVKVGFNIDEDIRRVKAVQEVAEQRAKIRIDANQAYTFDQAALFVNSIDPDGIELFEQPFEKDDWGAMTELKKTSPLPLMLDESIYHDEEIERSAREDCAHYLKFKLMKAGSARNLANYVERTRELGMKVVVGNGVASDLGCYHEALVAANLGIETAGEGNGFLKIKESLLKSPLRFEDGAIVLEPGAKPQIDRKKLESFCIRSESWQV